MLATLTVLKVGDLIKGIATAETQAEIVRQVLCEKPNFEPYSAFQRISKLASFITNQRLSEFLAENDIHITKHQAYQLIRTFDTNGDGKLTYNEFLQAILPRTDEALRKEVTARKVQKIDEDEGLPYQVEHALVRIFEEELESSKEIEVLIQELTLSQDFTVLDAFKVIDNDDHGYINAKKIEVFMKNAELPLAKQLIEAFMHRADKNADGIIRYSEFVELFFSNAGAHDESVEINNQTFSPTKFSRSSLSNSLKSTPNKTKTPSPNKNMSPVQIKTSSPNKFATPTKAKTSAEKFYSPQSTKASATLQNTSSTFKTPTKAKRFVSAGLSDESENNSATNLQPRKLELSYPVSMKEIPESTMNPKEEVEFVKGIKEVLEQSRILETIKENLALKSDFNTYNAFIIFDDENRGIMSIRQLEQGLQSLGLNINKNEVTLLAKRLDNDSDGFIRYEDFVPIITSKSPEFARLLGYRAPYYINQFETALDAFSEETKETYKLFLKTLIEQEVLFESIRHKFAKRKTFNLHDAYIALDRYGNEYVTSENFKDLLGEHGEFFSQKDIDTFVERFSKTARGKVSYYDFIREMTPKYVEKN